MEEHTLALESYFGGIFLESHIEGKYSHASMIFGREVFGEVIGNSFSSLLPVEAELYLLDATLPLVEAPVKCFGEFTAHVSSEDAMEACFVSLDWSGWLQMDHCNQVGADGNSLLAIEEDRTGLSLGGGCHDGADGLSLGEYQAVWSGSRPAGGSGGGYLI